jgi:hypothetical protein
MSFDAQSTGRWAIHLQDAAGEHLAVFVERLRPDVDYFRQNQTLGMWYQRDSGDPHQPAWMAPAVESLAQWLLAPSLAGIARELEILHVEEREVALPAAADKSQFPRVSVFDLVRRGLKPTASLLVDASQVAPAEIAGIAAVALSRFGFRRDRLDNLVFVPDPGIAAAAAPVHRMLYAGSSAHEVARLQEIEASLYGDSSLSPPARQKLQEELGVLLGFPGCCASAFARRAGVARSRSQGDFYSSLLALGWHWRLVDWRVNHVVARQYELPFLIHVPCSDHCAPTMQLVQASVDRLYDEPQRAVIREVLSQSAIVLPDDRIILLSTRPASAAEGEFAVTDFNIDRHPEVLRGPRSPTRRAAVASRVIESDQQVERIRAGTGGIEVFAGGKWRRLEFPEYGNDPALMLLVRPD